MEHKSHTKTERQKDLEQQAFRYAYLRFWKDRGFTEEDHKEHARDAKELNSTLPTEEWTYFLKKYNEYIKQDVSIPEFVGPTSFNEQYNRLCYDIRGLPAFYLDKNMLIRPSYNEYGVLEPTKIKCSLNVDGKYKVFTYNTNDTNDTDEDDVHCFLLLVDTQQLYYFSKGGSVDDAEVLIEILLAGGTIPQVVEMRQSYLQWEKEFGFNVMT